MIHTIAIKRGYLKVLALDKTVFFRWMRFKTSKPF
jgi:hypothetical protein